MRLSHQRAVEGVIAVLAEQVAPVLTDQFASEVVRRAGLVLSIAAAGMDDAVDVRLTEAQRICTIFNEALQLPLPVGLGARLASRANSEPTSYRISALEGWIGDLRFSLVDLHAWLELQPGEEERALDQEIWRALKDFEMARAPRV